MQYYGATKEAAIKAAMRDGFLRSEVHAEGVRGDWTAWGDYNAYFLRKRDPRGIDPRYGTYGSPGTLNRRRK